MWRRLYLALIFVRLYFALSPSYIHPDEHFQGPEIIAGQVFDWPTYRTWEFTSDKPIRSLFPLWLIYGPPLTLLKWIWEGLGYGDVPPSLAFYTLRVMMFTLSFVLEDWAIHELVPLARPRRTAILLVASSYVTWTFQTHTFSNSIETLVVLWCMVLMTRLRNDRHHTQVTVCAILAFLGALGVFNRITFLAFLVVPAVQLAPYLIQKPLRVAVILMTGLAVVAVAIVLDTHFYTSGPVRLRDLPKTAVFTPWNNLVYNLDADNLALHGTHPFYQHFVANLPQLLGPAILLLPLADHRNPLLWTAFTATALLSCFSHQEARFLLPVVPLVLASVRLPDRTTKPPNRTDVWVASWVIFNIFAGLLFGTLHQAGVIPTQTWLGKQNFTGDVFWWKTYSPPRWLLDSQTTNLTTIDLMGLSGDEMLARLQASAPCSSDKPPGSRNSTYLVAPPSIKFLEDYQIGQDHGFTRPNEPYLEKVWSHRPHVGLDDLDIAEDGLGALNRAAKGLAVYNVASFC